MPTAMEGRPKRGVTAHPITLIQEPICNRWRSGEFSHRHRPSRPKCLFVTDKIKPIGSEPTSPAVNCAGQVKGRIATEEKLPEWPIRDEKKRSMFKLLACSFQCVQGKGLPPGDSDEEEGDDGDDSGKLVARWFTEAEDGVEKAGCVETASEMVEREKEECLAVKLPPGNALQLMRGKSAHS
ncbi:hypothetical protein KSP40_PGU020826 [Platanthera guangdongensis]|uniref:Uncharacterized protein n=1 Tax=Platanthera guangdongensis TaxID=2320717 RepID=A0ABR2N5C6_9ASPA